MIACAQPTRGKVMSEQATLILTSVRPRLAAAVAEAFPVMKVIEGLEDVPAARIEGRVWCFVDWLLPETSGLEMCRALRDAPGTAHAHITMVLEEDDGESRRRALRAGADDYMLGPLSSDRLVERLRRYRSSAASGRPQARLIHGDLTLDLAAHQARWHGKPIPLRPNEFRLLVHFIEHPDQVFSRTGLIAMLGKECQAIDERTVDVWVGRLRRALKAHGVPDPLRTVRSMGYVLDGMEHEAWQRAS